MKHGDGHSRRVLLFSSSLAAGGSERVLTTIAEALRSEADCQVALVTIWDTATDFFTVSSGIERVAMNMAGETRNPLAALLANRRRINALRRLIESWQPDAVISFCTRTNLVAIAAARLAKRPIIVSERADPACEPRSIVWRVLRRVGYPFADRVVAQTDEAGRWLERCIAKRKIAVIPNPVRRGIPAPGAQLEVSPVLPPKPYVVAVGRLYPEKGFDLLLPAYKRVIERHDVDLVIVGDGPCRSDLVAQANLLGIGDRVHWVGQQRDPMRFVRRALVFALPSRQEGFPNALAEAMAEGCAVVAFDCPSGPRHVIRTGVDGLLVENDNPDALAAGISRLLSDERLRMEFGAAARSIADRLSLKSVLAMWIRVVDEAICSRTQAEQGLGHGP